jgi:hypothetical protein
MIALQLALLVFSAAALPRRSRVQQVDQRPGPPGLNTIKAMIATRRTAER